MHGRPSHSRGFTLIEAIMVIVITGILAGIVAVFIKSPVDSYVDLARRAELTDIADTAVRRIARDIHLALPNSVRNPDAADQCVEFMPTKIGGRYRAAPEGGTGNGDPLDFTATDGNFDMLWANSALPAAVRLAAGDVVAVYNDGSAGGNAYAGTNAIKIAGLCEPGDSPCDDTPHVLANSTEITLVGTGAGAPFNRKQLPAESPSMRFQVIPSTEHVVAYICSGVSPNITLYRYAITLTATHPLPSPAACPAIPAGTPILAENLTRCSLKYEPPGSGTGLSRNGILSISLEITQAGEGVRLYHQVHVDNTP